MGCNGQCSKGDNCGFRHDVNKRGQISPSNPSPNSFMQQNEWKSSRTRSPGGKRVPVVECQGLPQRNLHQFIQWKVAPSRMLALQDQEWLSVWGKCLYAHRQVDEQPRKRYKNNDDKSAVAMLKKNDWHENVWHPVVNLGKSHDRSGRPDKNRDHELKRGPTGRRPSIARQFGCVFQDMKPLFSGRAQTCRDQSNV